MPAKCDSLYYSYSLGMGFNIWDSTLFLTPTQHRIFGQNMARPIFDPFWQHCQISTGLHRKNHISDFRDLPCPPFSATGAALLAARVLFALAAAWSPTCSRLRLAAASSSSYSVLWIKWGYLLSDTSGSSWDFYLDPTKQPAFVDVSPALCYGMTGAGLQNHSSIVSQHLCDWWLDN